MARAQLYSTELHRSRQSHPHSNALLPARLMAPPAVQQAPPLRAGKSSKLKIRGADRRTGEATATSPAAAKQSQPSAGWAQGPASGAALVKKESHCRDPLPPHHGGWSCGNRTPPIQRGR